MLLKDTFRHKGLRKKLVDSLERKGIRQNAVLHAINAVPRHWFMDSSFDSHAYVDKAFPIAAGQTISQPYTVAFQTQLLQLKKGDKVLEIGTGSGYQAAILVKMGMKVYSIERQNTLFKKTSLLLAKIGFKPRQLIFGDGYKGLKPEAPFDGILVTAGAAYLPKPLLKQLKIGGRLVIPLGIDSQVMTRFTRKSEGEYEKETFGSFRFVPLVPDTNSNAS